MMCERLCSLGAKFHMSDSGPDNEGFVPASKCEEWPIIGEELRVALSPRFLFPSFGCGDGSAVSFCASHSIRSSGDISLNGRTKSALEVGSNSSLAAGVAGRACLSDPGSEHCFSGESGLWWGATLICLFSFPSARSASGSSEDNKLMMAFFEGSAGGCGSRYWKLLRIFFDVVDTGRRGFSAKALGWR